MIIAPSILSADFTKLGEEVKSLDQSTASYIHIDIMDGSFVPNLTFGASIVKQIRHLTKKIFDVHIMVNNPENYIDTLVDAGADIICFHAEATVHHQRLLSYIKDKGIKSGLALNPSTSESVIKYLLPYMDQVVVMTVNPGFGGQNFLSNQLDKIRSIKSMISGYDIKIEVDGGVSSSNALQLKNAGADILVAGTSVFKSSNYQENINALLHK